MPEIERLVKKARLLKTCFLVDELLIIFRNKILIMAIVAQLVRASACGAEGRRFESGLSPHFTLLCDFKS